MSLRPFRSGMLALVFGSLTLAACGGGSGSTGGLLPSLTNSDTDLRPYKTDSEYADVLVDCVSVEQSENSCSLTKLPIIGMEYGSPMVDDIMSRVVVSHDWMAERFEQALYNLPADIRLLLRATTAIVIGHDIRPAYYTAVTGAIYLDPAYLWLTPDELATVSTQDDPRSGYDDPLQFRTMWRYVKDGDYTYPYGLLEENPNKTIDDVALLIGRLLYHELAHANDFLPPATWDFLNSSDSVYEAIVANEENFVATRLVANDPLTAEELSSLANVMYFGETPSDADLAMTATEVGELFEADVASDHYAYATPFEDSAMLFEEVMMKYHFDIDRDVAFTDVPLDPQYCDSYIIGWGVRNRVGDTDVKARAQFVVGEMLPSVELSQFFQDMPAPQYMTPGSNWCDSLAVNAIMENSLQKASPQLLPTDGMSQPHGRVQRLQ